MTRSGSSSEEVRQKPADQVETFGCRLVEKNWMLIDSEIRNVSSCASCCKRQSIVCPNGQMGRVIPSCERLSGVLYEILQPFRSHFTGHE